MANAAVQRLRRRQPSVRATELTDALEAFVNHLRRNNIAVPVDKFTEASGIFLDECARSPDDLSRLKHRLTPLFATSAANQKQIARQIDAFFLAYPEPKMFNAADRKTYLRSGWMVIAGIAALLVVACLAIFYGGNALAPPVVQKSDPVIAAPPFEPQPIANQLDYPRIEPDTAAKPLPTFEFVRRDSTRTTWSLLATTLALILPLLLFFLWWLLRLTRRRSWMQKADYGREMPSRLASMFGADGIPIENSMGRAAANLNSARTGASGEMDLPRTINATARAGGFLEPVFRDAGSSSDYVVLIQRLGPNDHLARVSETMLDRIEKSGVRVRRYYYRTDPRQCSPAPDARKPMPFSQLTRDFGRHRFLVIGSADGFFHPTTGALLDWKSAERTFLSRALLTSRRPEARSYREEELVRHGYFVSVAGPTGVATYASAVSAGLDMQQQWAPPPRYGREVQQRVFHASKSRPETPPDRSLVARLLRPGSLREGVRQWGVILDSGRKDARLAARTLLGGLGQSASPAVVAGLVLAIAALGTWTIAGLTRNTVATVAPVDGGTVERSDLEVFRDCTTCPDMAALPAGTFLMGSPETEEGRDTDEGPQRSVTITRFALARTEVTFDQWEACVAGGGCTSNKEPADQGWGRGDRPVINVSWQNAQEYINWLNAQVADADPYRLPTEAEWEYAARAGSTTPFAFGETISTAQANYRGSVVYGSGTTGDFRRQTVPVGELEAANAWSLRHMHGNVWEWVEDCWHDDYRDAPSTSFPAWLDADQGDCSLRVVRGGSWSFEPQNLRSASRVRDGPDYRGSNLGFRPARTLLTP